MQVDHLFVIVFTAKDNDETAKSGRYLYDKKRTKEPLSKCLVHIDTRQPLVGQFGSHGAAKKLNGKAFESLHKLDNLAKGFKLIDGSVASGFDTSDNVGVYLVFHCSSSGVPYVFDREYGPNFEVPMYIGLGTVAKEVVRLIQHTGLAKIRKLCLVACTTTKGNEMHEDGFLGELCKAMKGAFDPPPMIAGWDDYLTVVEDGSKKVSGGPSREFPNQKRIAVYKGNQYEIGRLEGSGWSDKQQLSTNLGPSSTLK